MRVPDNPMWWLPTDSHHVDQNYSWRDVGADFALMLGPFG
jgi:hypothetical protein